MATLYELTDRYKRLLMLAEELDEDAFKDTLESIDDLIEDKADAYAIIDKKLQADEEMFAAEIKRLQDRKRSIANNRKNLKASLYDSMKLTGKEKFKTDKFSFWVQKNRASVIVEDLNAIPKEFLVEEIKVDKTGLGKFLAENEIDGARLEVSEGVRIR